MQRGRLVSPHTREDESSLFFYFSSTRNRMNATDLVQGDNPIVAPPNLENARTETIAQWTHLVRRYYPNLATPIARALAQRAAGGPYGFAMQSITQGLAQFDKATLGDLTGSELQMLSALLLNLREATQRLLAQVNGQWHPD